MIVGDDLERYARNHSSSEDTLLKELAIETYASMKNPHMMVGALEGGLLQILIRVSGASRVLELGTFTGYSALMMAEALPDNGQLITCDVDPNATRIARRYWSQSSNGHKISLVLGPALDTIERLSGEFDLVFIDADKKNYIAYWEACVPRVRRGGLIIADNVLWKGRVLTPSEEHDVAIDKFNKHVAQDDRVKAVVLTIRDGLTLALRNH
jgi:caffeoyl-CoA O-methyltransferase